MKKAKLLMPLIGVAALSSTVAPVMAMTGCSTNSTGLSENDKNFLTIINNYMGYKTGLVAPHKAISTLKNLGYDVTAYQLNDGSMEFAFDSSAKRFIIMKGDEIVLAPENYTMENTQAVFKFTKSYDKDSKYGQYLLDDYTWDEPTAKFTVNASIDVGNNVNIKYMEYQADANNPKTKVFRTYTELFNVNAEKDMIYHLGAANNVNVNGNAADKCKFVELGKVAYAYVEHTILSVNWIDTVDKAEIDCIEVGNGVTKGVTFVESLVGKLIKNPISGVSIEETEITPAGDADALQTAIIAGKEFIRITGPIALKTALSIADVDVMIDLCGHTISDGTTEATASTIGAAAISIASTSVETSATFIDSYRTGKIELAHDHCVKVTGNSTNKFAAKLYLEGVEINHSNTLGRKGAVCVGTTDTESTDLQWSKLFMFGGKITSTTTATVGHSIQACGIYLGQDAYAQIIYGAIYSDTICVRSNGSTGGGYIAIINATLKVTKPENDWGMCIYMPSGRLNITGGLYEGHCCLGIRGGETTISGGYFHATGQNFDLEDPDASSSGITTDGSVICVEVSQADAAHYGVNPSITVHNATLQSDKSYILNVYKNGTPKASVTQLYEADFYSGVFYYGKEASVLVEGVSDGIRVQKDVLNYCRVNPYGGSWIKTGEQQ